MLKINRASMKKLVYFQLVYNMIVKFLISNLGWPPILNYLTDVVTLILFIYVVRFFRKDFSQIKFNIVLGSILGLSSSLLIGVTLNLVSPLLVIWAIRNTYRFFAFFIVCVCLLQREDIEKIFNILYGFQIVNLIVTLYQYYFLGLERDYLGGIFGIEQGCNGATNIFFCILLCHSICGYISKKSSFKRVAFVTISTMFIVALVELKIYYIEFIIILFLSILLSKPSKKMFMVVVISVIACIMGVNIIENLFPEQYAVIIDYSKFMEYANSAGTGGYNISRLSAFSQINNLFFHDNILYKLFGFGFGNCETSNFPLFISPFFKQFGYYNYRYFAHAMIFLETGYIGLILFISFFVSIFVYAVRNRKKLASDSFYSVIVEILVIITVANLWYNYTIRIEISYLVYFCFAIVAILMKSRVESNNNK